MNTVGTSNADTQLKTEQITQATTGPNVMAHHNKTSTTEIAAKDQDIAQQQERVRKFMSLMVYGDHQSRAAYKKNVTCNDICAVRMHIDSLDPQKDAAEQTKLSQFLESVCEGFCKRMEVVAKMARGMAS